MVIVPLICLKCLKYLEGPTDSILSGLWAAELGSSQELRLVLLEVWCDKGSLQFLLGLPTLSALRGEVGYPFFFGGFQDSLKQSRLSSPLMSMLLGVSLYVLWTAFDIKHYFSGSKIDLSSPPKSINMHI